MLSTLVIVFREVLEAALVIGIAMVAVKKGVRGGFRWIYGGVVGGMVVAVVVAMFAQAIAGAMSGMGQELFNATILLTTALLMVWTAIWMRKHGQETSKNIRRTCEDISSGNTAGLMLSVVVGLAVAREGSELVLFMYGVVAASGTGVERLLFGASVGLMMGILVAAGLFKSLVHIPIRHLFSTLTALIALLAAGMASQGVAYLVMVDALPALGQSIWNTSAVLPEQGVIGQILQAFMGYDDRPSGIQVLAFVAVLSFTFVAIRLQKKGSVKVSGAVAAAMLLAVLSVTLPIDAEAKKIYSPVVEEGELEFEYLLDYSVDSDPAKDGSARHQYELEYAVSDRWMMAVVGDFRKKPGVGYAYQGIKFETIYQLFEQGEMRIDTGFYLEYVLPSKKLNKPDVLEFKMLFEKELGRTVNTANLVFKEELGSKATKSTSFGYAWRTKWRWTENLEPAIEVYGSMGELGNIAPAAQQSHQAGPVLMGKLDGGIGYEIGYLFGLTQGSDNGMIKLIIGYEF